MRYSSGARFSRAKPTGSFRVLQSGTRQVASHDETLKDARASATYWMSAVGSVMEIQERFPSGKWVTVETVRAKRPSQGRVVSRHGLGTADVRTGEGSYWIVTVPTGYRVDYKRWGPSGVVDLGTFSSRKKARAKITAHAGSADATIVS
jgi:hypothetical protein